MTDDGRRGPAPLDAYDPRRIGPYRVLSRLGRGGMARVFLGLSPAGRLVAIKTILAESDHDEDFRRRFAREVQAARLVSGVFTAAVVAADPAAARPWLATAYVPAPSLREVVDECGPLPPDAVRWLAAGVAEALGAIHGAGLVHRDLAPGNILVTLDGPKVIDFGLALAQDQDTVNLVGTIAYMAPEQVEGESGTVRSDVYAMGATLLFAGAGHAPYQGSAMRVMSAVRNRDPDLSGLPPELLPLVESCLRRRADRRPTPERVVADFAELLTGRRRPYEAAAWLPRPVLDLLYEHERRIRPGAEAPRPRPPRPAPEPEAVRAPTPERPRPGGAHRSGPDRPPPAEPTRPMPAPAPTRPYTREPYRSARAPMLDRILYDLPGPGPAGVLASSLADADLRRWHPVLAPMIDPEPGGGRAAGRPAVRFGPLGGRPTLIRRTPGRALVLMAPARSDPAAVSLAGPRHALALGAAGEDPAGLEQPTGRPAPRIDPKVLDAELARCAPRLRARAGEHADVLADVVAAVLARPDETFALSEADGVPDPEAVLWGLCDLVGPLLPYTLSFSTLAAPEPVEEPRVVVHAHWPEREARPAGRGRHRIVPGEELYSMGDVHRTAAEALVRCYTGPDWTAAAAGLTRTGPLRAAAPADRSRGVLRALEGR
ncbi:serine/threonine-protein kinase [Embleya hyalina]|uniref:Serine/threonine-protein kinase AfsK n=1 Tax=Embleya hyalina TaxID=516124 RepID=A0A401Z0L7_9ACTN|nr:serine/threonine-protein kinase [Embleya hyalina]GCE00384.1 serine/threonine-protein kinase AfsK [Embleya hyalina]